MKKLQVLCEMVLIWVIVASVYLFRENYQQIIYGSFFLSISWFYYLLRNKTYESCYCNDELFTELSLTIAVGGTIETIALLVLCNETRFGTHETIVSSKMGWTIWLGSLTLALLVLCARMAYLNSKEEK